jgi:hypothetical protein
MSGRGVMRCPWLESGVANRFCVVAECCNLRTSAATRLDHVTVENLMETELLDISLWRDKGHTRPFGVFDDVLPFRQALAAMGLSVRDDYDPEALRSYDEQTDDVLHDET